MFSQKPALVSLCCVIALADGVLAATSVEEVRRAHAAALKSLKTGEVVYAYESTASNPPADAAVSIARGFKKDSEQAKHAIREMELNTTSRREHVQVFFNTESAEWKLLKQDVRNLDQIIANENLPQRQRATLDTSQIILTGRNLQADFHPVTNTLFINEKVSDSFTGSPALSSPLRFGVFSDDIFRKSQRSSIESFSSDNRSLLRVMLDHNVLEVDPEIEFRCLNLKLNTPEGRLVGEERFGDYRLVDGFYFPFKYERDEYDQGKLTRHSTVVVESAQFNHPLPSDALQLVFIRPVHVLGVSHHFDARLPDGQSLGISQLQAMYVAGTGATAPAR